MVFEDVIKNLDTAEKIKMEIERATIDLAMLKKERDVKIENIRSDYVGGVSKIETYIDELQEALKTLKADISLETVDTKYPTTSIEKAI